jgi:hypothetical protein
MEPFRQFVMMGRTDATSVIDVHTCFDNWVVNERKFPNDKPGGTTAQR